MNQEQREFYAHLEKQYDVEVAENYAALVESPDYIINYNTQWEFRFRRQEKTRKRRKPTE